MAKKRLATGYTFTAASKTVAHADFSDITLAGIQLIVNVTDQIIIYNFADTTKGGTLATDTLTLEYDTTTMSDTDELMILVEDGSASMPINDGGNTITVDGTVAVTNAGLTALNGAISGTEVQVDVLTSALPSGASTSANQTTIIGHLDGVEGLLTTIDADTSNLSVVGGGTEAAAIRVTIASDSTGVLSVDDNGASLTVDNAGLTALNGAISGTEVQVDVLTLPAIPAGNNNIGDVDVASIAAGDNNIGNVDIVTLPAIPAGTNAIGKLLPPNIDVTGHTNYAKKYYTNAGAATDGIIWSPAAGTRWHITSIYIQVSAAATITLEDDKAGGDEAIWKSEFTANQGVYMQFDPMYPWASGEDAADLIITTTAGNVYVTAVGYEI